jgi:DNA-binding winged helix-turn-helix (wHTH) protein
MIVIRKSNAALQEASRPNDDLHFANRPVMKQVNYGSTLDADPRVQCFDSHAIQSRGAVSFGPFRLVPTQYLLLDGGTRVPLRGRAMQILMVLVERSGELVTKQELMDRVWPKLYVQPASLTVHISALRRALRDGRDGNRFIINIPGRGYCFVAPTSLNHAPRGAFLYVC